MAIDKGISAEDLQGAEDIEVMVAEGEAPEIEITIDPEEGIEVEIGEDSMQPLGENLAEVLDPQYLMQIGSELLQLFDEDKASRQDWEDQYAKGMEALGFSMEERTRPFKGACGVHHPLLSESIVQFQAQALKELMPAGGPVRSRVLGKETREKLMQAQRVKEFMNYQLTTVMQEYTPDFDQLLFYVGYGGSAFRKVYYDQDKKRMVSSLVLPDDLYIPYNGSSVMSECERIVHRISMSMNVFRRAVYNGQYADPGGLVQGAQPATTDISDASDELSGFSPNGIDDTVTLLEFHVNYDLMGFEHVDEDGNPTGICLPYVITVDESTGIVVGVRKNWKEDEDEFARKEYFVHYLLVQGPGAYGLGFLHLIGGLTKTATTALRQLVDAGTLSNLPAGFKARGARIMNDDQPLQPGEWRDMDAGGVELQNSMLPLPYKEPSQTLMALLGFCVDAGRRMASITDLQVGDSNQNAAVGTTIALLEKGSSIMSAIHKRLHYSQSLEFRLLAEGFGKFLPPEYPYSVPGESRVIKARDFSDEVDVLPVSDPNIFSVAQRITLAQTSLQLAQSAPQMHNLHEAYRRMYEAIGVKDIDALLPSRNTDKPKDPASENADALDGVTLKAFAGQHHDAHLMSHLLFGMSAVAQSNPITLSLLQKHMMEHTRLKAEEAVEAELFKQYGMDPDSIVSPIQKEGMVAIKVAQFQQEFKQLQEQVSGANQPPSDPLVDLKAKEIEVTAQRDQAKAQEAQQKLDLERQKYQTDTQISQAELQMQEAATEKTVGKDLQIAQLNAGQQQDQMAMQREQAVGQQQLDARRQQMDAQKAQMDMLLRQQPQGNDNG